MKINIQLLLVEVVAIVFGVVIGFMIADFRSGISEKKEAPQTVERIQSEIISNELQLEFHQRYYQKLQEELDSISKNRSVRDIEDLPSWKGPLPPNIRTSAYRLAISIGSLKNIDMELATRIDNLYAIAESYTGFASGVLQFAVLDENASSVKYQMRVVGLYNEYAKLFLREAEEVKSIMEEQDVKVL